jgi:hypothetical protein
LQLYVALRFKLHHFALQAALATFFARPSRNSASFGVFFGRKPLQKVDQRRQMHGWRHDTQPATAMHTIPNVAQTIASPLLSSASVSAFGLIAPE